MLSYTLISLPVVGVLLLWWWWRRRPRVLPFDRIEVPCASCWRPTAFGALAGGRCLDCRLAPFFAEVAAHAHEPPRAAYDVPTMPPPQPRTSACTDCGVTLHADWPWRQCHPCLAQHWPTLHVCVDCGAYLGPRHPWASCTACTSARVTTTYLARTTRRPVAVSDDELRRIWDRVAW